MAASANSFGTKFDFLNTKQNHLSISRTILLSVFLLISIFGCSSDDTDLPPERPLNTVSGKAVDGILVDSTVSIFAFSNGQKGERLGIGTTDADGDFAVDIRGTSQVVLIEVSGGSYVEQASGTTVNLQPGQVLRGAAYYDAENDIDFVLVSSLTHTTVALAQYYVSTGSSIENALLNAQQVMSEYFSISGAAEISLTETIPVDLTTDTSTTISAESLYAFHLAAMSNYSAWASTKDNEMPHQNLTTIGLLQLMYEDISADGLLDGIGDAGATLSFGNNVTLNISQYRAMFSIHLLAVSNLASNNTQLKLGQMESVANEFGTKTNDVLGGTVQTVTSGDQVPTPDLGQLLGFYSGIRMFFVDIEGFLPARKIEWRTDEMVTGLWVELLDPITPEIEIDTKASNDGTREITVRITDQLDNIASAAIDINIDNTSPTITMDDPVDPNNNSAIPAEIPTNLADTVLTGTYDDNFAGVQSILLNGVSATLNSGDWSATVPMVKGENIVAPTVTDNAGNTTGGVSTKVYYDDINPQLILFSTSSVNFDVGDPPPTLGTLEKDNLQDNPLLIDKSKMDLNSIVDADSTLDFERIPYFTFRIRDNFYPDAYGASNKVNEGRSLSIEIVHTVGGQEIFRGPRVLPDHCASVNLPNCIFNIVLVSEHLGQDWDADESTEQHVVTITVTDPAGNSTSDSVSFYANYIN